TPARRVDTPAKANGTARFGIDVSVPGMKVATVAASPVLGGKLVDVDDRQALAVPGVRQIVRLDEVVAVVADGMWAAKQALPRLVLRWDDGPNGGLGRDDVGASLAAAAPTPRTVVRSGA